VKARIKSVHPCWECTYLTEGKWYEAFLIEQAYRYGRGFHIIADTGATAICLEKECSHLGAGDWELREESE